MKQDVIEYGNGRRSFVGRLFRDESLRGPLPGVLVFPEAFGLDRHSYERAQRLAQMGYVALAADPHGDAAYFDDLASVSPAIRALYADRAEWRSRAQAALDALVAQPHVNGERLGAIGFCFGGTTCLELARSGAPLKAIVTFHAGVLPELEGDAGRIVGRVLICHGADDPIVKKEALDAVIAELRRDGVDWQLLSHGNTGHSFTHPQADARGVPGFAYNAQAERRSWAAMRALFDEAFQ